MERKKMIFPKTKDGLLDIEAFLKMVKETPKEKENKDQEYVSVQDTSEYEAYYQQQIAELDLPKIDEFGEVIGERILITPLDSRVQAMYERFDAMRKIGEQPILRYSYRDLPDAKKTFVEQAKFMEDFEDDFDKIVPFHYRSSLKVMDNQQLRCYFTFRTHARKQLHYDVSYNYIALYLNELVNLIGVKAEQGASQLLYIWDAYRKKHRLLDFEMPERIKDFCLVYLDGGYYHALKKQFPHVNEEFYQEISEIQSKDYQAKIAYFNSISTYKIMQSKFYTKTRHSLVEDTVAYVLTHLQSFFEEKGLDLRKTMLYKSSTDYYQPFVADIYYYPKAQKEREIILSNIEWYHVRQRGWHRMIIQAYPHNGLVGYLLKVVEETMRKRFRFKYALHPSTKMLRGKHYGGGQFIKIIKTKVFYDLIGSLTEEFLAIHIKAQVKVRKDSLEIDKEQFHKIRLSSHRIQEQLIVEEDVLDGNDEMNEFVEEELTVLTPIQHEFLKKVVQQESIGQLHAFARSKNTLIEVLVEQINEKALELVGDGFLEVQEEVRLFDEYLESVLELLLKESKQ